MSLKSKLRSKVLNVLLVERAQAARRFSAELKRRVKALEKAAREAEAAGDWTAERDEIKGRVERLVGGLEELLDA